ncbi:MULTISPECIES: acyltransferase [Halomonadaceae]|uniref:acyltransferase family protein n=1 Tax=Halomonadaceae TaxID=28256 RepID=UPI00159AB518|nr:MULTISPECIES: acyltransferase [Halomonas]QJQ96302.1 acyltransferase [Halomonas sp. PA5]
MKRIEEIYWLRFHGCIAVFFFHFLDRINLRIDNVYVDLARIPTVLGTPTFIFISIFLFSVRYGNTIPERFLANRVKYVMLPYLVYGLIYSTAEYFRVNLGGGELGFLHNLTMYLVYAGWHGYFLIIAMQFYAFYWCYTRYHLERWLKPGPWVVIGSIISILYWGLTRWLGIDPPGYLLWIAPLGWIYLFFLALLLVSHYPNQDQIPWLRTLARPIWLVAFVALVALLTLFGWLEHSSKETWVVPLFILFTLCSMHYLKDRSAPPVVKKINEYSFGIYLAHPLFFAVVDFVDQWAAFPLPVYALLLIVVGFSGSIGLNALVNRVPWGGMLFGKKLAIR